MHPTLHPNFIQFLIEFNQNHDYFECHELLEEYWKEIAPRNKQHPIAALILLSTSMYHWRRGNFAGARKTMRGFLNRITRLPLSPYDQMIDCKTLIKDARQSLSLIEKEQNFQQFTIQIMSDELRKRVHLTKNIPQDIEYLTHKHMLRDRSQILAEREKEKKRRQQRYGSI